MPRMGLDDSGERVQKRRCRWRISYGLKAFLRSYLLSSNGRERVVAVLEDSVLNCPAIAAGQFNLLIVFIVNLLGFDYQPVISLRPLPISARLRTVFTPASCSAANFSSAVPLPPEMIAPAWPMRLPGGAVTPAM